MHRCHRCDPGSIPGRCNYLPHTHTMCVCAPYTELMYQLRIEHIAHYHESPQHVCCQPGVHALCADSSCNVSMPYPHAPMHQQKNGRSWPRRPVPSRYQSSHGYDRVSGRLEHTHPASTHNCNAWHAYIASAHQYRGAHTHTHHGLGQHPLRDANPQSSD